MTVDVARKRVLFLSNSLSPSIQSLSYQLLRLDARAQPARLHHGHGHGQQQACAGGVAGGADRAGDTGDGRVLSVQDGVGGRHGAAELGHGLLDAIALAGA